MEMRPCLLLGVILATTALACGSKRPPMPAGACYSHAPVSPQYDRLRADGRIDVVALFGQMDYKRELVDDHGTWSARRLKRALVRLGYARNHREPKPGVTRFHKRLSDGVSVRVDVVGPRSLPHRLGHKIVGPRLAQALRSHEIVYFNGHAFEGNLASLKRPASLPDGYRVVFLDTCWSQQHYSLPLLAKRGNYHVISNTERSITGSVDSFVELLEALVANRNQRTSWRQVVGHINSLAADRAVQRILDDPSTEYADPEYYGLSALCAPM